MKVHYFVTELAPGQTRIDVVYQDEPPIETPGTMSLFGAIGSDADDAKANLIMLAKEAGESMIEDARDRAEGVRLAVRELTT